MPQREKYTVDQLSWMIVTTVHCNVWHLLSGYVCYVFIQELGLPNGLQSICIESALEHVKNAQPVSVYHHFPNMISLSTKGGGSIVHPLMSAGDTNGYNWGHTYMTSALETQ